MEERNGQMVPVIHWLAVDDAYSGKGYARMLITQVLKIFEEHGEDDVIYLHTQPCSYRAIKLYNDFGFCMSKADTYGDAINEYVEAMPILEKYMEKESYAKLLATTVS